MKLLDLFQLGSLRLKNRVVMAPMTRSRADVHGVVGELTATYYAQRATAGLIISEATNISEEAVGSPMTPGIWNAAQVGAWRHVTEAVHAAGGLMFSQLWHTGRVGHSLVRNGRVPVAPSAIAITGQQHFTQQGPKDYEVPRELTTAEVRATIDDYEHAARNAKAAGFDGVELHAAFGYLPNQFLVDGANRRTDEYGGSIENRARFTLEVMDRLVGVWGKGRVGIRLSPTIAYNGMIDSDPLETFGYLIRKLDALPLAYLHMMRSPFATDAFPHWPKDAVATFGPMFRGPVIANGGYTRDSGEEAVASGAAAVVSYGALYVANPDLVRRFELGALLNEGDRGTFYHGGPHGYIDYPALDGGGGTDPHLRS